MTNNNAQRSLDQTIIKIIRQSKPENVKQIINLVKEKLPISEHEIIETILRLQNEGKISLTKQQLLVSPKLVVYLKTQQALWYWLTIAIVIAAAPVVLIIQEGFYPWIYIRYILGTIFVLWLPGYAFIKALFPTQVPIKLGTETLDTIERITLSLCMSIALVPLVGLLLNYTPWGIRLTPIILILLALTAASATIGLIREYQAALRTHG